MLRIQSKFPKIPARALRAILLVFALSQAFSSVAKADDWFWRYGPATPEENKERIRQMNIDAGCYVGSIAGVAVIGGSKTWVGRGVGAAITAASLGFACSKRNGGKLATMKFARSRAFTDLRDALKIPAKSIRETELLHLITGGAEAEKLVEYFVADPEQRAAVLQEARVAKAYIQGNDDLRRAASDAVKARQAAPAQ